MAIVIRSGGLGTPVSCGTGGATVRNQGASTVYYRDEYPVDATTNDGSLASGASGSFNGGTTYFYVVSGSATLEVTLTAASTGGGGSGGIVNHGATAGTARPSVTGAVEWVGSVAPTNAIDGDIWTDTSA